MIGNEDKQDFYVFDMPFSGNLVVSHTNYIESGQADYEILNSEGNSISSFRAYYDNNKGYAYDKDYIKLDKGRYYIKACGYYNGPYHFVMSVKPEAGGIESVTRNKTKATVRLQKLMTYLDTYYNIQHLKNLARKVQSQRLLKVQRSN